MNKQQHIEEMAKIMPEKIKDPLDNSRYIIFGKSLRREIARIYYNAGYRKTFTSDLASDTQKALKEGYIKGSIDRMNECKIIIERNEQLLKSNAQLEEKLSEFKKPIDKFIKDREKQAVKEFAERLKNKLFEFFQDNEELDGKISVGPLYVDVIGVEAKDGTIISLGLIDKLLKEYEK